MHDRIYAVFIIVINNSVVDLADTPLKKVLAEVNLETGQIIHQLYTLYQGTSTVLGKRPNQASSPSPKESRSPASLRLKLRLLPILTKSTFAANSFPSTVQVSRDVGPWARHTYTVGNR